MTVIRILGTCVLVPLIAAAILFLISNVAVPFQKGTPIGLSLDTSFTLLGMIVFLSFALVLVVRPPHTGGFHEPKKRN